MTQQNDDKSQTINDTTSSEDNQKELDEQELDSVSGGTASNSSFKNYGKGGPVIHTYGLGPKQDDPSPGGSAD